MKRPLLLLLGAVVVGIVLRGVQAGESLWLDELHTSWTVTGNLSEVAERAMIGNQSPLYFWLAWFFARLPIMPEVALRLPSLLAGSVLPLAIYWLTKKMLWRTEAADDNGPALLAAWLAALDPLAIFYAQEARPYALVQLLVVLHIGALLQVQRQSTWLWRAAWIVSGALLVHLHYTTGLILIAELIAMVIGAISAYRKRQLSSAALRVHALDFIAIAILLLPAFPGLADVAGHRMRWSAFVKPEWPDKLITLFPCLPMCLALIAMQCRKRTLEPQTLLILCGWLLTPLLIAWTATVTGLAPLFFSRYLVAAWPASIIAAGLFWIFPRTPVRRQIYAGLILAWQVYSGAMWLNWYHDGRLLHDRNDNWRQALATLDPTVTSNRLVAPVLVRSGLIEADELPHRSDALFREYCLLPVRGMYRVGPHHTDVFHPLTTTNAGQLQPATRAAVLEADEALLLIRSSRDPERLAQDREELLRDLQLSLGPEITVVAEEPALFGSLFLQRVLLNRRGPRPFTD